MPIILFFYLCTVFTLYPTSLYDYYVSAEDAAELVECLSNTREAPVLAPAPQDLVVVMHTCNLSTQEILAGGPEINIISDYIASSRTVWVL